jgi:hypothetical protein
MNLVQVKLLESKGYTFEGTTAKEREAGGTHYVAIAFKDGKRAEASGTNIGDAERNLVLAVVAPGKDRAAQQWRREEGFLRRMRRRYGRD